MITNIPFIYVGACEDMHIFSFTSHDRDDIDSGFDQMEIRVHEDNLDVFEQQVVEGFTYYFHDFKKFDLYVYNSTAGIDLHCSGTCYVKE